MYHYAHWYPHDIYILDVEHGRNAYSFDLATIYI